MLDFSLRAICLAASAAVCVFSAPPAAAQQPPIRSISAQSADVEIRKPGQLYRVPTNTVLIRSVSDSRDRVLAANQPLSRPEPPAPAPGDRLMASALQDEMGRMSASQPTDASNSAAITAAMSSRMDDLALAARQPKQTGVVRIGIDRPMGVAGYRPHPDTRIKTGRLFSLTNYRDLIQGASRRHGVEEALVRSVIHAESAYNPKAKSHVGAGGLMQLMPATAARFGVTNRFDPAQNIDAGTKYLAWLLRRYQGDVTLATAAYNAGEGAVDKYKGVPPYRETKGYVVKVGSLLTQYRAALAMSLDDAVAQMR